MFLVSQSRIVGLADLRVTAGLTGTRPPPSTSGLGKSVPSAASALKTTQAQLLRLGQRAREYRAASGCERAVGRATRAT